MGKVKRLIHLVDNLSQVNFGIWNAAVAASPYLLQNFEIESVLVYPEQGALDPLPFVPGCQLFAVKAKDEPNVELATLNLDPSSDLIVSHGCWRFPTVWGSTLQKLGYKWLYVPHGMLEPWSMQQKKWKKRIYYAIKEYPLSRNADLVRAVSRPEQENLAKLYAKVSFLPNGADIQPLQWADKTKGPITVVFMARLHHKKGIIPLVQAWLSSQQAQSAGWQLLIAGPDDGELQELKALLKTSALDNVKYLGPIYGQAKTNLLDNAHYYALPSFSEGFPTSVVEAMQHGCVPLISNGCNFPEAQTAKLTINAEPEISSIQAALKTIYNQEIQDWHQLAIRCRDFIIENYSNQHLAAELAVMADSLL